MATQEKKRRGLGRGLSALMSDEDFAVAAEDAGRVETVNIAKLKANPYQPRTRFAADALDDLVASVKEKGVLTPLLVRPAGEGYEIIAGERRWRAAQRAGVHELPIVVRSVSDKEALEIAIVENVQRADLSPVEEARSYRRLIDEFEYSQDDVSRQVGKSRSHIANMLRLLSLPDAVQKMVDDGQLSMGQARALIGADDPVKLARMVADRGLNTRQVEALAKSHKPERKPFGKSASVPGDTKDADTRALEAELIQALGLTVTIHPKGAGGRVAIDYGSLDQLDLICERLMQGR